MICPNCHRISKNEKTCEYCQQPLQHEGGNCSTDKQAASSTTEKNRKPGKKKKGWKIAAVLVFLLTAGAGSLFAWQYYSSHQMEMSTEKEVYIALSSSPIYTAADLGAETEERTEPGQLLYLAALKKDGNTLWGQDDAGSWHVIQDASCTYFLPSEQANFSGSKEEKTYEVKETTLVYAIPRAISKPLSKINAEITKTVFVYEIWTNPENTGERWGRVGEDQWARIQLDGTIYLIEQKPEETAETNSETEEDETIESTESSEEAVQEEETPNEQPPVQEETIYPAASYTLNYDMNTRTDPSYGADVNGLLEQGSTVEIFSFQYNPERNSTWGEIYYPGSGIWICIQDDTCSYLG